MKTTIAQNHVIDFDDEMTTINDKIKGWIDNNYIGRRSRYTWKIGITSSHELFNVCSELRKDINCKNLKYWQAESFRHAMEILRELHLQDFVSKSEYSSYFNKGKYIFIYKTLKNPLIYSN